MPRLPKLPSHRRNLPPELYTFMVETRDCLRSLYPVNSLDVLTSHTSAGVARKAIAQRTVSETGGITSQFRVHTVGDDYLICYEWDGAAITGDLVYIAKPFHLRRTPFDGLDVTYAIENPPNPNFNVTLHYVYSSATFRTASLGGQSEGQTVIPRFALDRDIIYASEVEQSIGINDPNGSEITLVDINADGRSWAKVI